MNAPRTTPRNASLEPRLREIRAHWSTKERRQRAEIGNRRIRELLKLIDGAEESDAEIWAVGAPTWDDLRRLNE